MKWFCHLFALYFLVLSCIPCSDSEQEHGQKAGLTTTYLSAANSLSQHEHCADACSPFCGSSCCSVTFIIRLLPVLKVRKIALVDKKAIFPTLSFRVNDVAFAIDHPPQLI